MALQKTVLTYVDPNKLKYLEGNRDINPRHVERIKAALERKNLLHVKPLIVTPEGVLIDGQTRREAAVQLGLKEVPCLVVGAVLADAQILNTNNRNWTSADFAESFAKMGNKHYAEFVEFRSKYKFDTGSCIRMLQGHRHNKIGDVSSASFSDFKEGRFRVGDRKRGDKIAELIMSFRESFPDGYKSRGFVRAAMKAANTPGYDHKNMMKKINGKLLPKCGDTNDYLAMLQRTYNRRTPKNKKLMFVEL